MKFYQWKKKWIHLLMNVSKNEYEHRQWTLTLIFLIEEFKSGACVGGGGGGGSEGGGNDIMTDTVVSTVS